MTEGDFLDEVFSEVSSEPVEAVETVETQPEPDAPVRDEKGRFAAKGENEGVSPAPVEEPQFDHAAVIGERKRRQDAEARAAALEAQLQSLQQEPPAPPPSVFEDEEAFGGHLVGTAVQQASFNARLDMSEMLASQAHEDFDAMKAKFVELMSANPALQQEALSARHPWEKAYQIAKNATQAAELGATNVSELEAKIEARIRAELQTQAPSPAAIPTTLADHQSMRGAVAPATTGPLTIEDILGRR